jgi:hypothetical protein
MGEELVALPDGSVVVAGQFQETVELAGCSATFAGEYDALIARISPEGECAWLRSFGGTGVDMVTALSFSADRLIVAGPFQDEMTVGAYELAADEVDAWIAVMSLDGDVISVATITGPGEQTVSDVLDAGSSIFVAGSFEEGATVEEFDLPSPTDFDGMLWSFDGDLHPTWARSWGGIGADSARGIDVRDETIFVTGYFYDTMELGADLLESAGGFDAFLGAIDLGGTPLWAVGAGGPMQDQGTSVKSAASGGVLWTGAFRGPFLIGGEQIENEGLADGFLATVSAGGDVDLVLTLAGLGVDGIESVSERGDELLLTGAFTETLVVGSDALTSAGSADVFAARVAWDGASDWSIRMGTESTMHPDHVGDAATMADALWMTGSFAGKLTGLDDQDLLQSDDTDLFLVRTRLP